jgi:hypothetical protein
VKISSQDLELFWLFNAHRQPLFSRRPLVPAYRVGELLQPGRRNWPTGAQYTYGTNGHELSMFVADIDQRLVQDVGYGDAEFAVIVDAPVILLAYRFGESVPWADVPYCWQLQPLHCRVVPPPDSSHETRALLWITLIGAEDGLIYAQRGMTLAPEFTGVLHDAIRNQARTPFLADRCLASVGKLLVAHPSTKARLPLAQARTIGNR